MGVKHSVLLVQHNRAVAEFNTTSEWELSFADETQASKLADNNPVMETGYYDVLLLPGRSVPAQFNRWAMRLPKRVYDIAIDHIILVR